MTFLRGWWNISAGARGRRALPFRHEFSVGETTRVLDIGSEDGTAIARVLAGTDIRRRTSTSQISTPRGSMQVSDNSGSYRS